MLKDNWILKSAAYTDIEIKQTAASFGVSLGMAKTLLSRTIDTVSKFQKLKSDDTQRDNPYHMPDMSACVERIKKAIDCHEKILIYGDYDADGVTSVALMYLFLTEKNAIVDYYIPDRFKEGYGINREVVSDISNRGFDLIITVDTGISAHEEIRYAKDLGIDTIVTDHHECLLGVPDAAVAVVNPHRDDYSGEFKDYSGVGVAFMVAMAFEGIYSSLDIARKNIYEKYSDIAAIGTVADVMPMCGENKNIVKEGLKKITSGNCNKGITALLLAAKGKLQKVTTQTLGFVLGPRINAAGRLVHASEAVDLFLCQDYKKCCDLAKKLCSLNAKRQETEAQIMYEACRIIEQENKQHNRVIVVGSEHWNQGVIGIVCSRIVEKYSRPALLFCYDGDNAKGSGRSLPGFNLAKAIDICSDYVEKYGGHELAAGLTVKRNNLSEFTQAINEYANSLDISFDGGVEYNIDAQLYPNEMTLPFAAELEMLEPFGQDNPEPLFLLLGAKISEIKILSQGKHTKFILNADSISFEALMFSFNAEEEGLMLGDKINIVFTLEVNEYMGKKKVCVNIKDFCYVEEIAQQLHYMDESAKMVQELPSSRIPYILPGRAECIPIYKKLALLCSDGEKNIGYRTILGKSKTTLEEYIKMRVILDIFEESGLISILYRDYYKIRIKLNKTDKKINIEQTEIYKKIKSVSKQQEG